MVPLGTKSVQYGILQKGDAVRHTSKKSNTVLAAACSSPAVPYPAGTRTPRRGPRSGAGAAAWGRRRPGGVRGGRRGGRAGDVGCGTAPRRHCRWQQRNGRRYAEDRRGQETLDTRQARRPVHAHGPSRLRCRRVRDRTFISGPERKRNFRLGSTYAQFQRLPIDNLDIESIGLLKKNIPLRWNSLAEARGRVFKRYSALVDNKWMRTARGTNAAQAPRPLSAPCNFCRRPMLTFPGRHCLRHPRRSLLHLRSRRRPLRPRGHCPPPGAPSLSTPPPPAPAPRLLGRADLLPQTYVGQLDLIRPTHTKKYQPPPFSQLKSPTPTSHPTPTAAYSLSLNVAILCPK